MWREAITATTWKVVGRRGQGNFLKAKGSSSRRLLPLIIRAWGEVSLKSSPMREMGPHEGRALVRQPALTGLITASARALVTLLAAVILPPLQLGFIATCVMYRFAEKAFFWAVGLSVVTIQARRSAECPIWYLASFRLCFFKITLCYMHLSCRLC
jgi:hypothetical protein